MWRKTKGFTLMEAILAVALTGIVITAGLQMLLSAMRLGKLGEREFDLQTSMRNTNEILAQELRYSTAVFIIPENSFRENNLTDDWDYIGILPAPSVGPNASEIVRFTSLEGGGHDKKVLVEARADLTYDMQFSKTDKDDNDSNLVDLLLRGYNTDGVVNEDDPAYWASDTTLEALNSLQVVDHGSATNLGRAIAYRSDERTTMDIDGRIAMVIDNSGSMTFYMDGPPEPNQEVPVNEQRVFFLKEAAEQLFSDFSNGNSNLEIAMYPFGETANQVTIDGYLTQEFHLCKTGNGLDALLGTLRGLSPKQEPSIITGGTNTGDGVRQAMYGIIDAASQPNEKARPYYMILLVDGESNLFYAEHKNGGRQLLTSKEDIAFVTDDRDFPLYKAHNREDFDLLYRLTMSDYNGGVIYQDNYQDIWYNMIRSVYPELDDLYLILDPRDIIDGQPALVNSFTYKVSDEYIAAVYEDIKKQMDENSNIESLRTFVIAVSSDVSYEGLDAIKNAVDVKPGDFFSCESKEELNAAFEEITRLITESLWYLAGPDL